jgi:hypothetical protein
VPVHNCIVEVITRAFSGFYSSEVEGKGKHRNHCIHNNKVIIMLPWHRHLYNMDIFMNGIYTSTLIVCPRYFEPGIVPITKRPSIASYGTEFCFENRSLTIPIYMYT